MDSMNVPCAACVPMHVSCDYLPDRSRRWLHPCGNMRGRRGLNLVAIPDGVSGTVAWDGCFGTLRCIRFLLYISFIFGFSSVINSHFHHFFPPLSPFHIIPLIFTVVNRASWLSPVALLFCIWNILIAKLGRGVWRLFFGFVVGFAVPGDWCFKLCLDNILPHYIVTVCCCFVINR